MQNKRLAANKIESSESVLLIQIPIIANMLSVAREKILGILVIAESEGIEINLEPIIEEIEQLRADIYACRKQKSNHIRSVVGTIEIAESDPDLSGADEYIRKSFSRSLNRSIAQKKTKRVVKHKTKKDQ